jgi:hypothetical protein
LKKEDAYQTIKFVRLLREYVDEADQKANDIAKKLMKIINSEIK